MLNMKTVADYHPNQNTLCGRNTAIWCSRRWSLCFKRMNAEGTWFSCQLNASDNNCLNTTERNCFLPLSFAFHTSSLSVLTSTRVGRGLVEDIINCLRGSTFIFDKLTVARWSKISQSFNGTQRFITFFTCPPLDLILIQLNPSHISF
jgi:hypothetical protein